MTGLTCVKAQDTLVLELKIEYFMTKRRVEHDLLRLLLLLLAVKMMGLIGQKRQHLDLVQIDDTRSKRTGVDLLIVVVYHDLEVAHVHRQVLDLVESVAQLFQVALHRVVRRIEYVDVQVAVDVRRHVDVECTQHVLYTREQAGAVHTRYPGFDRVELKR